MSRLSDLRPSLGRWLLAEPTSSVPAATRLSEASGDPDAYALLYAEAVRALDGQRDGLNELRSRTGILLSSALIIGGLLGTPATAAGNATAILAASGFLAGAAAFSLYLLWPTPGWRFTMGTKSLLADYIEHVDPATMPELHRSLAWHLDKDYTDNQVKLDRLYRAFIIAGVLVLLETMMWLVAIVYPEVAQ